MSWLRRMRMRRRTPVASASAIVAIANSHGTGARGAIVSGHGVSNLHSEVLLRAARLGGRWGMQVELGAIASLERILGDWTNVWFVCTSCGQSAEHRVGE